MLDIFLNFKGTDLLIIRSFFAKYFIVIYHFYWGNREAVVMFY